MLKIDKNQKQLWNKQKIKINMICVSDKALHVPNLKQKKKKTFFDGGKAG